MTTKRTRKTVVLCALQTAFGIAVVPTGADNAMIVSDVSSTPVAATYAQRNNVKPYLGNDQQLVSEKHAELSFSVEIAGSGAAGTLPAWDPLLQACSFAATTDDNTSVAYAPISDDPKPATIYYFLDGLLHKIANAYGTVALDLTSNAIPKFKFKFTGDYSPVVDQALPTTDFSKFKDPLVVNNDNTPAISLGGYAATLNALQIDMANTVTYRSLPGAAGALITDRKPTGSVAFELARVADKDYWSAIAVAQNLALSLTHGKTAGNIVTIAAPAVQLTSPSYTDNNGIASMSATLTLNPVDGNDELTITLT
ncbi:hypothetical protein [Paraburkholderia caribensis]|uniref:hypothetical protein n=1 Tax=Paraburkholderia caribensis TaxID=75105 RepID=UPI0007215521|nr:hypothetical protein [Paraburkholderia caribensis]ALP62821.1 hypothetical protein AN416_09580 [Paraburkholderia caribensis]AUT51948.1 hypothetical protein C2L66_08820 [Paraburkholderia caribensis]